MIEITAPPFTKRNQQLISDRYCIYFDDSVLIRDPKDPHKVLHAKRVGSNLFIFGTNEWIGKIIGKFPEDLEFEDQL